MEQANFIIQIAGIQFVNGTDRALDVPDGEPVGFWRMPLKGLATPRHRVADPLCLRWIASQQSGSDLSDGEPCV